ncbi:hypothetical protein [Actinoplanes sp. HUAS TT8]|uniref:hypothetical protein n=1 Tax=Actinoplanes sp. HUAS TT8 TaxID=3447453 RepID=UPI003F52830A
MEHTHCWRYRPDSPVWAAAWPGIIHDITRIVQAISNSVALAGPDGTGPALTAADTGIAFNGPGTAGGDSFQLPPPGPWRRHWYHCDTRQRPYDLAVTATLLRCHLLMPTTFAIGGDGSWHKDWRPARDLVHRLFGEQANGMPLSDTTAGATVEQLLGL